MAHSWVRILSAFLLLLCAAEAGHAFAEGPRSLKEAMFGKKSDPGQTPERPPVAHFRSEDGESFVMDETSGHTLVRFDGDDEVWLLTPTQGPKGDIIYKNDVGEPVLKATRWGGMILFSDDRPTGDPVAVSGRAEAFQPGRMSPSLLFQSLVHASRRVSLAIGRNFGFDAPDVTPGTDYLYADAADVTADALIRVSAQSRGKQILAPIQSVQFIEGRPPSASIQNGVLVLKLDISRGYWGGRPSSKRIFNLIVTTYPVGNTARR
ncbi:DUF4908 domain-containing protein [Asticcacaulis sp. AC466]|uniref:DUF4908 domain-containing protein n=1 Tax=Asticcacaulis sp. AC466 TaxID=1282362 RepID=UPI001F37BC2E|nr:DUF4908 domain-containing protein [Asticcacaulis sp. AC466]